MGIGAPALQPARHQLESFMKVPGNEVDPPDLDVPNLSKVGWPLALGA